VIVCAACGHENPDGARFCNGCGRPLATAAELTEERKVVSIVFVDLVGSTSRAERLDPEDVRAQLASYHARVRTELERHGGTVEKFIGDAVVAVFGAPVVHEDDAERAVRASIAIRDTVAGPDVSLRVAVNTGEALVSLGARPAEGEGMVAGDVVNTAARLQSAAPVDGILVGEGTYRATSHVIEYREVEPIVAKGKGEPVPAWEVVAARARFGSDVEQAPLAPLVAREQEVDQLRDALARVRRERTPELLTLVGVPGMGKSRLVAELFQVVDADPELITWRQGRCLPYGDGVSYWALGEMTKAQAGVLESDSAEEAEDKLAEAVGSLVADREEAAWVVGHLRPLVGLGGEPGAGAEARGEAFAAWRRFLEALAEQRPTVLVFEDLHWADDGLLDFVDGLVDRATGVPLLVVCSARPELLTRRSDWGGGKANAVTLSLSPLSNEDTSRLVAGLLSQAVLPAETQQALLRRAEGNPLFAEEYVRMLRDRGLLRREGSVWRLEVTGADVPETVQAIIAARLDALTQEEKALLQDAAVVGKVFWQSAVAAIAGRTRWEVDELLHALERKELVRRERRASVAGEVEYAFRHVLVRDVAYGQIPRARRADVHERAATWIEGLGEGRAEDHAEMLAHHYLAALELLRAAGGDVRAVAPRACAALCEAGDRAWALSALEASARAYRAALELMPRDDPERPGVLLSLGRVLFNWRNEGVPELREAAAALLEAGDVEGAAEAESLLGNVSWMSGAQAEARAHNDRAVELVDGLAPTRTTVSIRGNRWRVLVLANEHPSLEEGEEILALSESVGTTADALNARINLGIGRNQTGDERGMGDLEVALEQALQANSHVAARAYVNLASHLGTAGDLRRSAELHREGLEVARRFGSTLERWLRAECVLDDFHAGDWDTAIAGSLAYLAESTGQGYMDAAPRSVLASTAAARGDESLTRQEVAAILAQAREIGDPQMLWPVLATCALRALEAGHREKSMNLLDELTGALAEAPSFAVELGFVEGFLAADALDRAAELTGHLEKAAFTSPWVDACAAIGAGRREEAADVLEARGALTLAALVRLHTAERAGRETPGLQEAVAFYERVGATAYLARAARLLQATA
jgi:class 3 adenylate cyclase/tetratricopeptide (TPR) repeat protein